MEYILTTASSISCDHSTPPDLVNGGPLVLIPAQTVFSIEGDPVLVGDLTGSAISPGCNQVNSGSGQVICATVNSQIQGTSAVLTVDGQPVLLESTAGLSSEGIPDKAWSAKDPQQSFVQSD